MGGIKSEEDQLRLRPGMTRQGKILNVQSTIASDRVVQKRLILVASAVSLISNG